MRIFLSLLSVMTLSVCAARAQDHVIMAPTPRSPFPTHESIPSNPPEKSSVAPLPIPPSICPGNMSFFPTGFTFSALLPDAIYSYNTLSPVVAVIEDNVKFRGNIVLPKNSRLIGTAGTVHTLDRVNINWTLAVTPEGCEFPFSGLALSADDGSAGVKGKLEKHEDSVAALIALKSVLVGVQATAAVAAPVESAVTAGFSNEAAQMLDQNVSKVKSLESIYIHERTPIRIFVLQRFIPDAGSH